MTRTHRSTTRRRRIVASGLVGVTAALALVVPSTAQAGARVASPEVAAMAADAVTALERWETTGSMLDYARFVQLRSRTATVVANAFGEPGVGLRTAWANTRLEKQHAMLAALSQLGVPYRSMRSEEGKAFDCSGLMLYAFHRAGVELPRSSRDQFRDGEQIEGFDAQPGDLVYYPGHISMFIGMGLIVHSPYSGSEVEVRLNFDRSVRYADVFDGDVQVFQQPVPMGGGASAQTRSPLSASAI